MSEQTATDSGGDTDLTSAAYARLDQWKVPLSAGLFVLLLRPVISSDLLLGYGTIASTILIWMIFVSGFNLLLGYTGVLSFGHAMFLGFGMYSVAIGFAELDLPFLLSAVIGLVFTAVFAYAVGTLIASKGEIYFAMLTIAFGQAVYFVVNQNPGGLTGGSDGISGAVPGWIRTYRGDKFLELGGTSVDWYWIVAVVFLLSVLALWQIVRSPFGRTLVAVRENESLARAMGVDTRQYKVVSFTLSALFAAVAGILLEVNDQGAVLETLHWSVSGDAVLMSVLGGMSYFAGPFLGVFVWLFTESYLTSFGVLHLPLAEAPVVSFELGGLLTHWQFLLGLLFLLTILTSPEEGIWGHVRTAGSFLTSSVNRLRDRTSNVTNRSTNDSTGNNDE